MEDLTTSKGNNNDRKTGCSKGKVFNQRKANLLSARQGDILILHRVHTPTFKLRFGAALELQSGVRLKASPSCSRLAIAPS